MADRYAYIPSLGIFVLVVWGAYEWLQNFRWQFFAALGAVILIFCTAITRQQLPYWQNMETISRHALAVTQDNYIAHELLGAYFASKERLVDAAGEFQKTIALKPNYSFAYYNLGVVLSRSNHGEAAIRALREAIRLKPDFADAHSSLGFALFNHGEMSAAMVEYRAAVHLQPALESGYNDFCSQLDLNNLAWTLATNPDPAQRDGARAVGIAEEVCAKTQNHITIFVGTLAAAYAEAGRFDEAVATGQKACALAAENGDTGLLKKNQELVSRYQSHRPYRDTPAARAE
jgi:Flp pilus assembly protein TadD